MKLINSKCKKIISRTDLYIKKRNTSEKMKYNYRAIRILRREAKNDQDACTIRSLKYNSRDALVVS